MTMDERQRNFRAAKQEVKLQQAAEAEQEESTARERNFKAMEEFVANKQLTDIFKAVEKLAKQNENLQKKYAEGLQFNLQNYLDNCVVDTTASILKEYCEKMESMQRNNNYYISKINDKLEILLTCITIIFVSVAGFTAYSYFMR
ncbi:MAG: hypothetical protein IJ947_04420 [Phascolarctobacterium sp.]|nr:hypothetical protein [Phascolarctobacterium sp.]MBR2039618.1 hypothetical protein [Phascolarctobacterium sp.]